MASAASAQTLRPLPLGRRDARRLRSRLAGPGYVPGELVVRFEPGTTCVRARRAQQRRRTPTCAAACLLPRAYLLRLPKDRDVHAAQRAYERNPNVQYAEPNFVGHLFATPNDPIFNNPPNLMWAMHNTGQRHRCGPRHPGRGHRRARGVGRDDGQLRRHGRHSRHRESTTTTPTSRRTSGTTRANPAPGRRRTTSTTTETARSTTSGDGTSRRTTTIPRTTRATAHTWPGSSVLSATTGRVFRA